VNLTHGKVYCKRKRKCVKISFVCYEYLIIILCRLKIVICVIYVCMCHFCSTDVKVLRFFKNNCKLYIRVILTKKLLRLSLYTIDLVLTKVRQAIFKFFNRSSKSYDFLCGDALDVKWVHLICKNSQLHARKICLSAAVVRWLLCPIRKCTHNVYPRS
jgi:hypothetical protein